MTELWKLSAADMAAGIRKRDFQASEVISSVIARIEAQNPHINAITLSLAEQALQEAQVADLTIMRNKDVGPLHGVPITIKENIDMEGLPTTHGVQAFSGVIASEDAPLVRNLRQAGAIVVGRTNTPEFSMRVTTDNPLRGRTYNPWNDQISPGGSSGGAGAACATGMAPLNHGNDIGGSLRMPAFANGVMTIKPTSFRVPVFNSTATAERGALAGAMSVQGVIARHAADIRLATCEMIRPDPRDPHSPPIPWNGPSLTDLPTVAVTTESHGYNIHPGILELIEQTSRQLQDAGYKVVKIDPPPISEAAAGWFSTGTTEMKASLGASVQQYGSTTVNQIVEWYYQMSELLDRDSYINAFADRTRLMREWNLFLAGYPLVLTPYIMRPIYDWNYDIQGFDQVKDLFDSIIYSTGINYLGLPAGVISTGMVEGFPAAIQIVGQRYREDLICNAMEAIEARNDMLVHQLWK